MLSRRMNGVVPPSATGFGGAGGGATAAADAGTAIFARRATTDGRVARRLDLAALRFCLFTAISRSKRYDLNALRQEN